MIIQKLRKMTALTTSFSLLIPLLFASGVPSISQASAAATVTENAGMPEQKAGNWDDLKINWTTPVSGTDFNGAPVGNGYFGAKVSGGVATEILQLSDKTFHSGEPFNNYDPNRKIALDATRSLLAQADAATSVASREDHLKLAETEAMGMWGSEPLANFLPIGNIVLDVPNTSGYTDYNRELHLDKSIVTTKYKVGNTTYTREVFASKPDRVMIIRMTNDGGQPMGMTAKMTLPPEMDTHGTVTSSGNEIQMTGTAPYDDNASHWENGRGMTFDARLRARTTGGTITASGGNLNISGATVIELLYADATSYKDPFTNPNPSQGGNDPTPIVEDIMDVAFAKTYTQLLDAHQADHRSLFRRLWTEVNGNSGISRPFTLTYQYARYVSIAASRTNTFDRPFNENGMWNYKWRPTSYGAHFFNENVQKMYALIETGNLTENGDPLWKYIKNLAINGEKTAKTDFGFDGWMIPHASDVWAKTELSADDNEWSIWPTGGMWLMFNVYDHYRFTQDKSFLRETAFPLMKGSAEFALDYLVTNKEGYLVTSPSTSPETKYVLSDGKAIAISQGSTIDMTLIRELFENVLEAGSILEGDSTVDVDLMNRVRTALPKLLPYKIGSNGEIKEWNNDYPIVDPSHRHASHLIGVGFLDQITKRDTPDLFNAVKVSLNMRGVGGYHPDNSYMWARLNEGNRAISVADVYPSSEFVNEWQVKGAYYPELFVQSHLDNIDILPALPSTWTTGSFSGIKARGGFEVGVTWAKSRATSVQVKSLNGTSAKLSYPNIAGAIVTNQAGQNVAYTTNNSNLISFDTQVGDVYTISSIPLKEGALHSLKMKHSDKMLDIAGASKDEHASLVQMSSSGTANQQWQIVSLGNGYNKIVNSKSNKVIAVLDASISDGAQLVQQLYTADAVLNDEWQVIDQANGYYKLVNRGSGKALTVPDSSKASGAQLVQSSLTNTDNQLVEINSVSDPIDQKTFSLTVQNSQLNMDVDGGSSADGAKIIQWSAGKGLNQQWLFMRTDPGYYKIISQHSLKALIVEDASTVDGAGIIQKGYTNDDTYNDEWSVVDVGDGYYQLKNRGSGKVIEIPGGSTTGGVQFVQNTAGTGSNQRFLLSFDRIANDHTIGTGNDQFMYSGEWGYTSSESGAYGGDNHYSNSVDAYVLFRFIGSKVQLYGAKNNNQGIAAFSIDDGAETMVDTYASSRSDQQLLFESKGLTNQEHVLRVRVTGQKNADSNNTFLSIDRAEIQSRIPTVSDPNEIPQSEMKATSTSNHSGNDAGNAIDGEPSTIWLSEGDPVVNLPQSITLDLGKPRVISKLRYLPQQNGESIGYITVYELSTSMDGTSFTPVTGGSWDDDSTEKIAEFAPVASRYLKLTAIAGHGGLASAAEINIMKNEMDEDYQALQALITSVQSMHDSAIEGNEEGQYPEGSKLTLQKAIDQAKDVRDSTSVTQQQLQQAVKELKAALQVMEDSIHNHIKVQSITITSESSEISTKNGTLQLGATVLPTHANKSVTWAVYEVDGITVTDKATIELSGLLTAVKDGTVKVVATATDGSNVQGELAITISGQSDIIDPGTDPVNVETINISSSGDVSTITTKSGSLQLGATVLPANATNKSVTWAVYGADSVTATDLASINLSGLLTALKDGTVKVVATATDGSDVQGELSITISGQSDIIDPGTDPVDVEKINITSSGDVSTITTKNRTLQFGANVLPENATNKSVIWTVFGADGVTPTDQAIINSSGLLKAVKNGVVRVVATSVENPSVYGIKEITISGQDDSIDPGTGPGTGVDPGNPTTPTSPTTTPTPTTSPTKEDPHRYVPTEKELESKTAQNGS
ncbi:glycosyl hydrolase family 95 catalytic domain-containing protein, partial [Paenibacillus etheri]|uniref:glycosyl hydrolase family 95 catalytic domain-containing protein n=1 Tax=Paenibacillus etheri TaxID=1306852 RepID=UPI001AE05A5D